MTEGLITGVSLNFAPTFTREMGTMIESEKWDIVAFNEDLNAAQTLDRIMYVNKSTAAFCYGCITFQ